MRDLYALARRGAGPVALALALTGCQLGESRFGRTRPVPLPDGVIPEQVIDADHPRESVTPLKPEALAEEGRRLQAAQRERLEAERAKSDPAAKKKYNILALSGGGVYGAYSAGVLCGWTDSGLPPEQGGRPEFDVVTGISTGALVAPFAFLGPQYDERLKAEYTTVRTADIYRRRLSVRGILTQSLVDTTPFRRRLERVLDDCVMRDIAAEHAKGRRLIIGTTNIDTKRIVLWDIGAIAARGTDDAYGLVRDILLASAAIPGFFPPVKIDVAIDGKAYQEVHVDGSISRALFFRPPYFPPEQKPGFGPDTLAGSHLYVIVAGKINPAPASVKLSTFPLALESTSLLLYNTARGDLYRMYTYCLLTGMNYRVAAIPDDAEITKNVTEFDPQEMTKLFNVGYCAARRGDVARPGADDPREGTAWRDVPPGLKDGEKQGLRSGRNLTLRARTDGSTGTPRGPEPDKGTPRTGPPVIGGG